MNRNKLLMERNTIRVQMLLAIIEVFLEDCLLMKMLSITKIQSMDSKLMVNVVVFFNVLSSSTTDNDWLSPIWENALKLRKVWV